jgi:hypothetical protein
MNSKETIIVVALAGLVIGYLSRLATETEDKEAEVAVADEPIHIQRDVGSVSQVMTDTANLNGQAVGQNARNFGVSGSHGLTPGLDAFIDRATVASFGQNFNGRSLGLN